MTTLNAGCGQTRYCDIRVDIKRTRTCNMIADITHLPFRSETFETVLCFQVLEHIFHWRKALQEIARVGKNLIIEVPINSDLRKTDAFRLLFPTLGNLKLFFNMPKRARDHLWQFKPLNIIKPLVAMGYKIKTTRVRQIQDHYFYSAYRIVAIS